MTYTKELEERLEILKKAELIDSDIADFGKQILSLLFQSRNDYSQELLEIFITHIVMAAQRCRSGEVDEGVESAIMESLEKENCYSTAKQLLDKILSLTDIEFPKSEKQLLLIHLCNVCSN